MPGDETSPISAAQAREIFAPWKTVPAVVLAVSGGPDSVALMWLVARWRRSLKRGPRLIAVTVDHGLRADATREAREVKRLAIAHDLELDLVAHLVILDLIRHLFPGGHRLAVEGDDVVALL